MQAMSVRRLGTNPTRAMLFLDGKRVSKLVWDRAHLGRRTGMARSNIPN